MKYWREIIVLGKKQEGKGKDGERTEVRGLVGNTFLPSSLPPPPTPYHDNESSQTARPRDSICSHKMYFTKFPFHSKARSRDCIHSHKMDFSKYPTLSPFYDNESIQTARSRDSIHSHKRNFINLALRTDKVPLSL